jgi:hypothetical protein
MSLSGGSVSRRLLRHIRILDSSTCRINRAHRTSGLISANRLTVDDSIMQSATRTRQSAVAQSGKSSGFGRHPDTRCGYISQPTTLPFGNFCFGCKLAAVNGRTAVAQCTRCSHTLLKSCLINLIEPAAIFACTVYRLEDSV